jgi:hypothetical protein
MEAVLLAPLVGLGMLIIIGVTEATIDRLLKPGPLKEFLFRERRLGHSILDPVRDVIREASGSRRRRLGLRRRRVIPTLDLARLLPP